MIRSGIGTAHWMFVQKIQLRSELSRSFPWCLGNSTIFSCHIFKLEINYSKSSGDCTWLMQGCRNSNSVWCSCQHHGYRIMITPFYEVMNTSIAFSTFGRRSDFATKDLSKVDVCMKIHMYTYICIYIDLKWFWNGACVYIWIHLDGWKVKDVEAFIAFCEMPKPSAR